MLERLRGSADPVRLLASVPGIGRVFAERLHDELGIETLADLETAARLRYGTLPDLDKQLNTQDERLRAMQATGRLLNEEEFGQIIVRSNADGSQVLLRDVARIEFGTQLYNAIGRYNGQPGAIMAIYQIPGTNALEVAGKVREAMEEFSGSFPQDLGYSGPPFPFHPERRAELRAELDAYYARLYGLTRDELRYILDPADVMGEDYPSETFRVLKNSEVREFGEYRTQRLVLEAWDKISLSFSENCF